VQAGEAHWHASIYYPTYSHLDGLIVGVSLAGVFTFYPRQWDWLASRSRWLLAGGCAILAVASVVCREQHSFASTVFGFPLVAVGFGCIVAAALCPNCFLHNRRSAFTRSIAILSYSMYLIHKAVIHVVQGSADALRIDVDGTPMFLLCMVATFAAAGLLYWSIENPFMRLRERLARERCRNVSARVEAESPA
jgi:peptidoglycan/LPS O-acetylase OafA/YrhL